MSVERPDIEIALAWIEDRKEATDRMASAGRSGFRELNKLCNADPVRALHIVALIAQTDSSDPVMEVLAAGPLENLLVKHGGALIDQIEDLAKKDTVFRKLLGGVWQRETDNSVWERVVAARTNAW
jgi:hypothetical protein